jgi:hypothetical protein
MNELLFGIKVTDLDGSNLPVKSLWLRSILKYGNNIIALIGSITGLIGISLIGSLWGIIILIGFFFAFMDNKQTNNS